MFYNNNKVSPDIIIIPPERHLRKRLTPSPPETPNIFIEPPPPSPAPDNKYEENKIEENKLEEINIENNMKFDLFETNMDDIRTKPDLNLRYDRLYVHDYIYNYILFAYNFYNPIFTMYITIISYKQMNQSSSIFKNVVLSYAIIYPLIAMLILLNEAYSIYCKKFVYYKLMDTGVIFKWKKEYLYKSVYFWWYIISLIFICVGINDSWNVILIFVNQTSNLCIYIYNSMNIDSTLITLNGFFENNILYQTENIKKIIWIDEDKVKENIYSIIEARQIIKNNIESERKKLLSSFYKSEIDDVNLLIMENFDKTKHLLNTTQIIKYYKILEKCFPDFNIIGKIKLKRVVNNISECNYNFPFYKRKWVLTLLNEIRNDYNVHWNHKCANCDLLYDSNYYYCLLCYKYLCETCNSLNTIKTLKSCYESKDMDHKTISIYNNTNSITKKNIMDYPWYYKIYNHHNLDNLQIIFILDTIYYISIISIFLIEFYGFYIIFN